MIFSDIYEFKTFTTQNILLKKNDIFQGNKTNLRELMLLIMADYAIQTIQPTENN